MKLEFFLTEHTSALRVFREPGDTKFYADSPFLHSVKKALNAAGFRLIKKLMWKDGHMTADTNHYLRAKDENRKFPHICIWDGHYAIRAAFQEFNNGVVALDVAGDIYEKQSDWKAKVRQFCEAGGIGIA